MKNVENSKIDIFNFKSAIAPIVIIKWLYYYNIRIIHVKFYRFCKFEPILTILVFKPQWTAVNPLARIYLVSPLAPNWTQFPASFKNNSRAFPDNFKQNM